jgi:hypothetical protein
MASRSCFAAREIHEITRGSIVDYFGRPAIKSNKGKHDPNLPIKHWWITAQAAIADPDVASRLGRLTKAERWSGSGEFADTAMVFTPTRKTTTAWTAPTRQDRCAGARR